MNLGKRIAGFHWHWVAHRFGIWGVRDYYLLLEQMAKEGATFTFGYVLMILAATLLATAGLLLDNSTVIIGAMCVAPFLTPSRSVCIGALYRDRRILLGGLLKQLVGLLVVGTVVAYVITIVRKTNVPGVRITNEIMLRSMPTTLDFVLTVMVAIGAGAAASLALTADPRIVAKPWGQVIDAMIGVEVAISLLPPACFIGIGLALGRPDLSRNAFWLLAVNVVGLDFFGSTLMLLLRGVRSRYLVLENAVRRVVEDAVAANVDCLQAKTTVSVVLLSDVTADIQARVRSTTNSPLPESLPQTIASQVTAQTGCRSRITLEKIPCQTYSTLEVEEDIFQPVCWA
jgi:uncharacterized hydrophobic protein (TIGR00271 family)